MSTVAILPSNFNPAKLTAKPLKVLDNGGKAVNLEFDGRGLWMVQTPVTQLPYGMNIFDIQHKSPQRSITLWHCWRGNYFDNNASQPMKTLLNIVPRISHTLERCARCRG
jgi:hypothetical protein